MAGLPDWLADELEHRNLPPWLKQELDQRRAAAADKDKTTDGSTTQGKKGN